MKLSTAALALVLAALPPAAAGCGGGAATTQGTTTGGTTTGGTTTGGTTTDQTEEKLGEITELAHLKLLIDDREVDRRVDLFAQNLLATDPDGYVVFSLEAGVRCDMRQNSKVRVAPQPGTVLEFRAGTFWCSKRPDAPQQEYSVPGGTIEATDPVFGVEIVGEQALVKVTYGSVTVRSASGAQQTLVPALQAPVLASGTFASAPQAIQLTSADRESAARLQSLLPPIRVEPPAAGSAGVLGTVVATDKLSIAVDSADSAAVAFAESFAKALGAAWHVDAVVARVGADEAASGLAAQRYDIAVTPSEVQTMSTSTVPLFDDASGRTWSLNVARDAAFATSLQKFVSTDVLSGTYAKRYAELIAPKVTYEPVKTFAIR